MAPSRRAAPAIAADAFVDPEPVDVQPAPLDVGDDAAVYLALFILDKAGDPLAQMGAGVILVVARETNAQRFDLIVLRRLGWGELHGCFLFDDGWGMASCTAICPRLFSVTCGLACSTGQTRRRVSQHDSPGYEGD
jgi:hypothetical protein